MSFATKPRPKAGRKRGTEGCDYRTLDDLVLLCRYHHVLCHEGGWTLTRHPDGTITATRPDPAPTPTPPPGRGPPGYTLAA